MSRFPFFRIAAMLVALSSLVWFVVLWQRHADPVQRYDLPAYAHASIPDVPLWHTYTVVQTDQYFLAVPGDSKLKYVNMQFNHERLHDWLQANVYEGHTLAGVLRWPLIGAGLILVFGVAFGGYLDASRTRESKDGRVLRGPKLIGLWRWNVSIRRSNRGPFLRLAFGRKMYLPNDMLHQHVVIQGGSGTGKSVIARSLAYQLLARGPIIFLDIKREFVQEFAGPDDWILDPSDDRCPVWALEDESMDEMRATAPAVAAFPDEPKGNPFFRKHPRFIVAHILANHRPTTKELAMMIAGPDEIAKLLRETELRHSVTGSTEAASSMLATIAELGRSLRFWPNRGETRDTPRRVFSVSQWARERKGNIFFTSSPDTLDALKPSQSMLLDMLILAMQKHPGPGALILDEVAQMGRLPKLEAAMSLQRAAGNPIVLIFQEVSQLKDRYGDLWPALVSQAGLQFVLRTKEEQSATHSSGVLGKHEIERIRESRTSGWMQLFTRARNTYSTERPIVPAVLPGDIQSLENLCGYVSHTGKIAKFHLKYLQPVIRAPRVIDRIIKPQPAILPDDESGTVPPRKPARSRYAQMKMATSGNPT